MRLLTVLAFAVHAVICQARSAYGSNRILVVLDKQVDRDAYSSLWRDLQARQFELVFRQLPASEPSLFEFGSPAFDHLFLFAPSAKSLGSDLTPQSLVAFAQDESDGSKRNILIALNTTCAESWKDFAREFSIEFDAKNTQVIDHFNFNENRDDGSHSTVKIRAQSALPRFLDFPPISKPILYRGIAHSIQTQFPLAFPLLTANPTSFSYDAPLDLDNVPSVESDLDGLTGGPALLASQAALVTAFQTHNNARIVWSGSLDLFSDAFAVPESGNQAFISGVTKWLLQESGVLKVSAVHHAQIGKTIAPKEYRKGEEMSYSIAFSQYKNDAWQPVELPDLQLEVTMLDPHLRVPLLPAIPHTSNTRSKQTMYTSTFRLPERHGVFTFYTDYKRSGWSWIEHKDLITLTPLHHNEYPRFLSGAWPFYLGAISTSATFLLFVGLYLSSDALKAVSSSVKGKQKAL